MGTSSHEMLLCATELPRGPSCTHLLGSYLTFDIVLQKTEENAEGGESALGPDGEVRDFVPIFTVLC